MSNRIQEAFQHIHAEEELKNKTKAYLARRSQDSQRCKRRGARRLVPAVASLLLILLIGSGCWLYFRPTAVISIDINPSLELGINRFDKVVSVTGYNEDGQELAESLDIKYMDYDKAVRALLESQKITELLAQEEALSIGVGGSDQRQCERVLSAMESYTEGHANSHCYSADLQELEDAHQAGLSYGKYQAFLELRELDPTVTVEEVQGMTMGEIRDRIAELSGPEREDGTDGDGSSKETGGYHGKQNGHGHDNR